MSQRAGLSALPRPVHVSSHAHADTKTFGGALHRLASFLHGLVRGRTSEFRQSLRAERLGPDVCSCFRHRHHRTSHADGSLSGHRISIPRCANTGPFPRRSRRSRRSRHCHPHGSLRSAPTFSLGIAADAGVGVGCEVDPPVEPGGGLIWARRLPCRGSMAAGCRVPDAGRLTATPSCALVHRGRLLWLSMPRCGSAARVAGSSHRQAPAERMLEGSRLEGAVAGFRLARSPSCRGRWRQAHSVRPRSARPRGDLGRDSGRSRQAGS